MQPEKKMDKSGMDSARTPMQEIALRLDEGARLIILDVITNHLPRVLDGFQRGYPDENQILVLYDHAVRARVLREQAKLVLIDAAVFTELRPDHPLDCKCFACQMVAAERTTILNAHGQRHPLECQCPACLEEKSNQRYESQ